MSYQEKRTVVSTITGVIILITYCIYAFNKLQAGVITSDDMKAWAGIMLIFIGVGVVSTIVIQIVFHILLSMAMAIKESIMNGNCDDKEIEKSIENEMVTDEMDKLIELKSMRVGFIMAGIGFVFALVTQLLDYSPAVLLNVLFIAFCVGSIFEGLAQLYYYRKGVRNG